MRRRRREKEVIGRGRGSRKEERKG